MSNKKLFNDKNGFTLIELMVVLAILSMVIGAIYAVIVSVSRSCTNNEVNAEVMQNLRTSIEFMEQDIRMAGLDRFNSANAGIEPGITATYLRFTADRNMDGSINTADLSDGIQEQDLERITYTYDAASRRLRQCLSEGTTDAWDTVAFNVTNFQFTYLDENDTELLPPIDRSLIRSIQVSMTIERPAGLAGPVNRTITKRILCRNLSF